jgi:transcriptional regulator with XRE-family HTH domain
MSQDGRKRSDEVAIKFGRNLWFLRRKAGLSQKELAERASVHRTEIGVLEKGERLARIDTAIRLCSALEVPPTQLLLGIRWTPGADHLEGGFVIDDEASFACRQPVQGSAGESQTGLGRAIRALRERAGLSVADLSGRSGLERSELEAIERAEVEPTIGEIKRMARGLGIRWPELLRVVERFESEPES